jgi:hypothetical protein
VKVYVEHDVPVPSVRLELVPDREPHPSSLLLTFALGTRWGEPIARLTLDLPWRRPRPWELDVGMPWKHTAPPRGVRRFQWARG